MGTKHIFIEGIEDGDTIVINDLHNSGTGVVVIMGKNGLVDKASNFKLVSMETELNKLDALRGGEDEKD